MRIGTPACDRLPEVGAGGLGVGDCPGVAPPGPRRGGGENAGGCSAGWALDWVKQGLVAVTRRKRIYIDSLQLCAAAEGSQTLGDLALGAAVAGVAGFVCRDWALPGHVPDGRIWRGRLGGHDAGGEIADIDPIQLSACGGSGWGGRPAGVDHSGHGCGNGRGEAGDDERGDRRHLPHATVCAWLHGGGGATTAATVGVDGRLGGRP